MTTTVYENFGLFDGVRDQTIDDAWMKVNDETGRIESIGTGAAPQADNQVDLSGKYVMPGMINAHTHMCMSDKEFDGGSSANVVRMTVRAEKNLHDALRSGVTYIRECGSCYGIDVQLKKAKQAGEIDGVPNIMTSGHPFSMTGGHGDFPNFGVLVDSPDEMRKAVRTGFKEGAESIKVMATGGVMSANDFMNDPQLSVEEMHAAVEEAHHKGRIVAAHAEGNPGIMNAIKAGVDSIEHGFYVNDEEIDLMLRQGTYLDPTIVADWAIVVNGKGHMPDWELKKAVDAYEDLCTNIMHAWKRGVPVTLGTDAGTPFNDFTMTAVEFQLMVENGATPFEALTTSVNSSKLLKIDGDRGTLEAGKYADFLVLDGDPLEDVKAVQQKDKAVYLEGVRKY